MNLIVVIVAPLKISLEEINVLISSSSLLSFLVSFSIFILRFKFVCKLFDEEENWFNLSLYFILDITSSCSSINLWNNSGIFSYIPLLVLLILNIKSYESLL